MKSLEGAFAGSDGRSLFYRSWVPIRAAGCLLVLHGYEHSGRYEWVGEQLAGAGLAVFAPDHRGFGASARPGALADMDSLEKAIADIARLIAVARREVPDAPLFLLGHSIGGMLALLFAIRRPEGLKGLITSGAAVEIPEYVSPLLLRLSGLLSRLLPLLPAQPFDYTQVSRDPEVIRRIEEDPLYYKGKMRLRSGYQMLLGIREVLRRLGSLKLPILILHGGDDRTISARASQAVYSGVASEDKTLKIYPGLWHEILNEPEREQVLELVVDWLRRHLG
jgi:acylglycerol lipase